MAGVRGQEVTGVCVVVGGGVGVGQKKRFNLANMLVKMCSHENPSLIR